MRINREFIKTIIDSPYIIHILILAFFIFNVLLYANTTVFDGRISDSGPLIRAYYRLLEGESFKPLRGSYWFLTPAFIAYFLFKIFGTLHAFFIFQCLLSALTALIVYRSVSFISDSKISGIVSIILMFIYIEYILLSSVFYNQIFEIFFSSLFLWFVIMIYDEKKNYRVILYSLTLILTVLLSLMFRNTLAFTFGFLLILSILFLVKKKYTVSARYLFISISLLVIVFMVKPTNMFKVKLPYEDNTKINSLVRLSFWGHTMYGGEGGKATFIYKENEELYNQRLNAYALKNSLDPQKLDTITQFRRYEVKRFITQEPHKWLFLQGKKFFYTFGIIPMRDALQMLSTGRVTMHWILAVLITQIPYLILILLFLLTMDINLGNLIKNPYKIIIYAFGLYLVTGVCFYGVSQPRYRVVVFILTIIPIISINIRQLLSFSIKNGGSLIRLFFILIFITVWMYQGYEVFYSRRDRYFSAIEKFYD